ncbi:hypothetical protein DSO57_1007549 [Entomophthora muscae]|uniref:Uncharacterized protein n=1 Tax=Entomophthora muscae TaxID=34485 RepID=A0ACC2RM10_9FUNG|nr:hypothetical protein DSO57_1007549 [Entomophthora muscae]
MPRLSPPRRQLSPYLHLAPSLDPGEVFDLPQRKLLEEGQITFSLTADPRISFCLFCLLSKQQTPVTFFTSLNSLMFKDSPISLTVLVTVHRPFGKVKILALFDTGADTKFIKKDLADTIVLPLYGSLDIKFGKNTYTDTYSITQPVTFDLKGSLFRVRCNFTPNLSYPFILGFSWLKEFLLNFNHSNNKITFICNIALCSSTLNTN